MRGGRPTHLTPLCLSLSVLLLLFNLSLVSLSLSLSIHPGSLPVPSLSLNSPWVSSSSSWVNNKRNEELKMMTSKTHTSTSNYECCMCGDLGLSNELFRCKVCHFRSQHRYCSNLYPKAESYRVCNWCLIQKDDDDHETLATTTTTSYNNSSNSNSSSPETHAKTTPSSAPATNKKLINHHTPTGTGPKSPKCLQPTSPIKKPNRSSEIGSPSGRKRIQAQAQAQARQEEKLIRRTKSEEISNGGGSRKSPSSGGPPVIKHVFRNKVRRYKLLDEVSS